MRVVSGVYEGPSAHGILRVAASLKDVWVIFRASAHEEYFQVLWGPWARFEDRAPVSLSPAGGGTEDLEKDILEAVRRHPEVGAVIVARSDSALLSGEGVPEVRLPAREDRPRRLFRCPWQGPGIGENEAADLMLAELVREYAVPQEKTPEPSVNLFGAPVLDPRAEAEMDELQRLLEDLGVEVNARVPLGASLEDLRNMPRAWANVVLYREVSESATRFLKERFGMPRITTPMIGSAGTGAALRAVGEMCSIDGERVRKLVFRELARTAKLPWYTRLLSPRALRGKKVAIFGDFTYAVGLGYALSREVGAEIAWSGTYLSHLEHDFAFHAGTFTEKTFVAEDPGEVALRVERTRPDLLIATHFEREAAGHAGASFLPLCPPAAVYPFVRLPLMGYRGAALLADAVDGALRRARRSSPETGPPEEPVWTGEALAALEEIPAFLRGRARRLAEKRARELGERRITREILEDSRF